MCHISGMPECGTITAMPETNVLVLVLMTCFRCAVSTANDMLLFCVCVMGNEMWLLISEEAFTSEEVKQTAPTNT